MNTSQPDRVLIADDDFLVVETIRDLLEKQGYIVVGEASNGLQAIELVQRLQPDVILMDIKMPKLDGLEAARQIQDSCPTPVVVLTTYESPDLVRRATVAGVGAYLLKPPGAHEVERAITIARARFGDIMELRRLNAELQAALQERELLVRDTYHRVKNNLMVIESLLSLQADYVEDQAAREMFKESQTRVKSMLLIHEKLHQSKDLTRVDFADYIRKLVVDLFHAYEFPLAVIKLSR